MSADRKTIWKRRAVLMAVVGLIIAVPVTVVVRDGDDQEGGGAEPVASVPEVGDIRFDRNLGVELRLPKGWKRDRKDNVLTFRSKDGAVIIALSSPGPRRDADQIHASAVASIDSEYRKVELLDQVKKRKLGGRRARTAILSAKHPKKNHKIQILVSTAKGEKRAYLVEVFASGASNSLVEAQALLNNLTLTG